jgi:hypothetical protein
VIERQPKARQAGCLGRPISDLPHDRETRPQLWLAAAHPGTAPAETGDHGKDAA